MTRRHSLLRPLTALLLALALVVAAMSQSAMAGRMIGVSTVEICADVSGEATVLLDRQGNPVDPAPDCPICLATHLALATPPVEPIRLPTLAATTVIWALTAPQIPTTPTQTLPPARAPPTIT